MRVNGQDRWSQNHKVSKHGILANLELAPARRSSTTCTFISAQHGTVAVSNPYDWLEDTTKAETVSFIEAQNAAFASYLNDETLGPAKERLMHSILGMWKLTVFPSVPQSLADGNREYIVRTRGRGREFGVSYRVGKAALLGVSAGAADTQIDQNRIESVTIFYDEATYNSVLTASSQSPSGDFWVFRTSDSGLGWGLIRVKDTRTSDILADEVHGTKFPSKSCTTIPWLGDRCFFYIYYLSGGPHRNNTVVKTAPPQLRFYVVGAAQEMDKVAACRRSGTSMTVSRAISSARGCHWNVSCPCKRIGVETGSAR